MLTLLRRPLSYVIVHCGSLLCLFKKLLGGVCRESRVSLPSKIPTKISRVSRDRVYRYGHVKFQQRTSMCFERGMRVAGEDQRPPDQRSSFFLCRFFRLFTLHFVANGNRKVMTLLCLFMRTRPTSLDLYSKYEYVCLQ